MKHDDSVPHDTATTEMFRMHGEAAEASANVERLRSALQRALPELRRWCDVGHHDGERRERLDALIADCEAEIKKAMGES